VVKYIEGTPLPSEAHEWAGVFICSDDREVEQAFADAEPPAHDDWIPDKMPRGWAKTYVRVALSRLRQLASSYVYPDLDVESDATVQPSLARAADRLGELIPFAAALQDRPTGGQSPGGPGGSGARGTARRDWQVGEPRFVSLEQGAEGGEALFEVDVANHGSPSLRITAEPTAVIDGSLAGDDEMGDFLVPLIGWEAIDGTFVQSAKTLPVPAGTQTAYRIRVGVPDEAAVGIRLRVTDGGNA
jgi:hypothetical protein